MITFALLSVALGFDADSVAGRYVAQAENASCTLVLRAPAPILPDVQLTQDSVSGFALAAPNCPQGLSGALLWRYLVETDQLELVNGAGETLFTGEAAERGWTGSTPAQQPINLLRR